MLSKKNMFRLIGSSIAILSLALITVIGKNVIALNATSVALLYLLVVLATSAFAGPACGLLIASTSGLLVDYFFLPPFGTFYIDAPEDWVAFGVYAVTAAVVSYFAATVRQRAVETDDLKVGLSRLSRFVAAVMAVRQEDLTLEIITAELRRAYDLSYCAIYSYVDEDGTPSPVSSGTRPSCVLPNGEVPPNAHNSLLDVLFEEGSAVHALSLTDQGKTVGMLVISQISLPNEVANQITAFVTLFMRLRISTRVGG